MIAAVHGEEAQTEVFARALEEQLKDDARFRFIPNFNPWGVANKSRGNHNDVDLNRNLATSNWQPSHPESPYYGGPSPASEVETQIFIEALKEFETELVISFHTNHFVENANEPQINFDASPDFAGYQAAKDFAQELAKNCGLIFTEDIGYPTPGSLGSYAKENNFACITVEFDDALNADQLCEKYLETFLRALS